MKIKTFGRRARLASASRRSANFGERGFTLVEILVVITIIGLIMGLVGPRVLNYLTERALPKGRDRSNDPWGNPYIYRAPGQHGGYDIVSYGADGQEGGAGSGSDVVSWAR